MLVTVRNYLDYTTYIHYYLSSDELVHGSLHNLADLAEYFRLKKYVQDSERVQMYLSATSEALSIITGLSALFYACIDVISQAQF